MYFESHAHYDDNRFNTDRDELLRDMKNKGVSYIINAAANMKSSQKGIELSERYDFVYAAIGVHPHDASSLKEEDMDTLRKLSKEKKVVAIGEIGLDFFYDHSPRDVQRYWFEKQLDLADELALPVIIHSRDAEGETLDFMKARNNPRKGVIHCFSGSAETAREYVKRGYYLGIGGVVTYNNAKKLVEVVKETELKNLLIETDSPYLSPVPERGQRNDSGNLKYIVKKIAEIKGVSEAAVEDITLENAKLLFGI